MFFVLEQFETADIKSTFRNLGNSSFYFWNKNFTEKNWGFDANSFIFTSELPSYFKTTIQNFFFSSDLFLLFGIPLFSMVCIFFFYVYINSLLDIKSLQKTWLYFFNFSLNQFVWFITIENLLLKYSDYIYFIISIFWIILFSNVLGLLPYTYTITSHIIFTFTLAYIAFNFVTYVGIRKHGFNFYKLFIPGGTPKFMIPFIFVIEVISYTSRVFSLSIRLFANLMSGHTLLKLLSIFSWFLLLQGNIFFLLSLSIIIIISLLELAIAFLQAYVFTILIIIYFNDVVHGH